MCLAVPARVVELCPGATARVDMMGVQKTIAITLTPQVAPGEYVLVHAGYAIQTVSADEARQTLDLIEQFPELVCED